MRRMHDWMEADLQASSCHACPALHVPLLLRCLPGRRSLEVIQRMGAPACCKHANCLVALLRVAWLQAAQANRERTPWVLAAGHRPMYCAQAWGGRCHEGVWSLPALSSCPPAARVCLPRWPSPLLATCHVLTRSCQLASCHPPAAAAECEASRLGLPSFCPRNNPLACRPLHAPGKSSGGSGSGPSFPIEELFLRYGVDLAVSWHWRGWYLRYCSCAAWRCNLISPRVRRCCGCLLPLLHCGVLAHLAPCLPWAPPCRCLATFTTTSGTGPPTTTLYCLLWGQAVGRGAMSTPKPRCTSPLGLGAIKRCGQAPRHRRRCEGCWPLPACHACRAADAMRPF